MESNKNSEYKIKVLKDALFNFEESLSIDLSRFSGKELDSIKNGQVQKFEICTELTWKTMQYFMNYKIGIDLSGPKPIMKAFYEHQLIDQGAYETLFNMIETRNKFSHVYDKETFETLFNSIKGFLPVMKLVLDILEK